MSKLVHEPVDMDIDPKIRVKLRQGKLGDAEHPMEIADFQLVLKALSMLCQRYKNIIVELTDKVHNQKVELTKKQTENSNLRKAMFLLLETEVCLEWEKDNNILCNDTHTEKADVGKHCPFFLNDENCKKSRIEYCVKEVITEETKNE